MRSHTTTAETDDETPEETEHGSGGLWHVNHVLVGVILTLAVAALFSSGAIVDIAASREFGSDRDRWLGSANQLDDLATQIGADQPADELAELFDRPRPGAVADPGVPGDDVVLGDLAADTTIAPTTIISPPTTAPAPTLPSTTQPATTQPTTTTTEQRQLRPISADEPLLIWTGGDSLGEYIVTNLLGGSADLAISDLVFDYRIATGLTRPDFFDWPGQLSTAMIAQPHPEAVIFMIGGNDNQAMITDAGRVEFGTNEWRDEYRSRVATMMDITGYPDSHMFWIGLPVMDRPEWEQLPSDINTILADEASTRPWVSYVDIDALYRNESGDYDQFIVGPDGERVNARAPDGVHITRQGSRWIADLVWAEILEIWPPAS